MNHADKIRLAMESLGITESDLLGFLQGKANGKAIDEQISAIDEQISEYERKIAELKSSKDLLTERKKVSQAYVNEKFDEAIGGVTKQEHQIQEFQPLSMEPISDNVSESETLESIKSSDELADSVIQVRSISIPKTEPVSVTVSLADLEGSSNPEPVGVPQKTNKELSNRAARLRDSLLSGTRRFKPFETTNK